LQTVNLTVNLLLIVNLIFTVTVNLTVNRARATSYDASKKARLWNICPICYQKNKARVIDRRKRCPFCNSPMQALIDFFGEKKAIEEAREELQYRRQLRNEGIARRRMPLEASRTPPIPRTEGYDKEVSKSRVLA
jgi:hypothetical protein